MQLGTIILAGMCGVVGLVAGRASAPAPPIVVASAPPPPPRAAPVIAALGVAAPDPEPAADDTGANEHDDSDGTDVAAVLATLNEQAAALPTKQAVLGRVTGWHDHEPAIAATVVATGPNLEGERVVITDEHGDYQIIGLPPGYYTITIYYLDNTFVRADIASREIESTHLDIALSAPPPPEDYIPPVVEPEQDVTIVDGVGITFSGSVALDDGFM
jgi:hypothetical protein